jgi:hypothetical protein
VLKKLAILKPHPDISVKFVQLLKRSEQNPMHLN